MLFDDYPEFRSKKGSIKMEESPHKIVNRIKAYGDSFKTLEEVKFTLSTGFTLGFEYNGIDYYVEGHNNSYDMWISNEGDIANGLTLDKLMEFKIEGVPFKEFIFQSTVNERTYI